MEWSEFLLAYTATSIAAFLLSRRAFCGELLRLGRVLIFVISVFFIANYIAEDRGFWHFQKTMGLKILEIPIENIVFTGATALLIILLYRGSELLFLQCRGRKKKARPANATTTIRIIMKVIY